MSGDDGGGCGEVPPGVPVPGEVAPGVGVLFGSCGEELLGLGAAVPGLGAAVPGVGVALPGVGVALPGVGAAVPGAGLVAPGVVLWPGVPAWPPADPALPEPALCAASHVAESSTRNKTVAFAFMWPPNKG